MKNLSWKLISMRLTFDTPFICICFCCTPLIHCGGFISLLSKLARGGSVSAKNFWNGNLLTLFWILNFLLGAKAMAQSCDLSSYDKNQFKEFVKCFVAAGHSCQALSVMRFASFLCSNLCRASHNRKSLARMLCNQLCTVNAVQPIVQPMAAVRWGRTTSCNSKSYFRISKFFIIFYKGAAEFSRGNSSVLVVNKFSIETLLATGIFGTNSQ